MRIVWLIFGVLSLGAGFVGVVLPLVPTVPFLLLAAFCFARSSERLHTWLVMHPKFGPSIMDWRERGAISLRAKRMATVSIIAVFMVSVLIGLKLTLLAIQALTLGCVLLFIWSRPN